MAAADALEFFQRKAPLEPRPSEATVGYIADPLAYALSTVPMRTPRPIKVICVGAGFSGLSFAHEVEVGNLPNCELQVLEKNSNIGGTWFENRYPGCACDIPIHNYQWSWAPNPYFKSFYADRDSIYGYMSDVADRFNLRKYVKTSHKVIGAQWLEDRKRWQIQVVQTDGRELVTADGSTKEGEVGEPFVVECDVLINGCGFYNNWRWPEIPNRNVYQGEIYHTAVWPDSVSFKNKTVALIGNGSSGIQVLPAILDEVDKVYLYLRNRTWITSPVAAEHAGPNGTNRNFTPEEQQHWAEHPEEYLKYRKEVESALSGRFSLFVNDSEIQVKARAFVHKQMMEKLASKPGLFSDLVPDFPIGCRRPTPGIGYLEALCSEKVEIIWDPIDSFVETGIRTKIEGVRNADMIICATGFNMDNMPRFPVVGANGVSLREQWSRDGPAGYLSSTTKEMPNYFMYLGPGFPGHGSGVTFIEQMTKYIVRMISKLQTENYGSLRPKPDVVDAWQKHSAKFLQRTVFTGPCVSTFKNGTANNNLLAIHGGSILHFFNLLENPRHEDFIWDSLCTNPDNMFAWLANGYLASEVDGSLDKSYYLKSSPPLIPLTGKHSKTSTEGLVNGQGIVNDINGAAR